MTPGDLPTDRKHRVTVVLLERQIASLDSLTIAIRLKQRRILRRDALITAIIEAWRLAHGDDVEAVAVHIARMASSRARTAR